PSSLPELLQSADGNLMGTDELTQRPSGRRTLTRTRLLMETTSVVRKCFQALLPMHHVLDGGQGDLMRPSRPWRPVRPDVHVRQTPTGPDAGKLLQPYHFQPAPEPSAPQTER